MTDPCLLIGDIGGTNARFALANPDKPGFSSEFNLVERNARHVVANGKADREKAVPAAQYSCRIFHVTGLLL